jgi:hypothetical protein
MDTFANQRVEFEKSGAVLLMRLARTVVGPLIKIEWFALWFSTQKSIRATRILAYTIFVIALLVITARRATMWYHGSIYKNPFLRKGNDSV